MVCSASCLSDSVMKSANNLRLELVVERTYSKLTLSVAAEREYSTAVVDTHRVLPTAVNLHDAANFDVERFNNAEVS